MSDRLADVFSGLPDNPDDIAAFLQGQGIRARNNIWRSANCPLAVYAERVTGVRVFVGTDEAFVDAGDFVDLPKGCQAFIEGADAGRYPDLEAPAGSIQTIVDAFFGKEPTE